MSNLSLHSDSDSALVGPGGEAEQVGDVWDLDDGSTETAVKLETAAEAEQEVNSTFWGLTRNSLS